VQMPVSEDLQRLLDADAGEFFQLSASGKKRWENDRDPFQAIDAGGKGKQTGAKLQSSKPRDQNSQE
jgi:hypothetical protein